jgi:osmotically-inducible protein OsmY
VESHIFRDPEVPQGRINLNVEDGVVVLRGQLERPEQIRHLEASVRKVPGVKGVKNLLHLPGAPAARAL